MLELRKITKVYNTGDFEQKALDGISLNFRRSEFASILGPSGSGKTTLLNIIGGLDGYTDGNLLVSGVSTKRYNDANWDSYRNHRIGFVFQSYNLIPHQSILNNVRLALTVSGISKKEGIARAKKALEDVGLGEHVHKRPAQLSGGQMQRVAIARALVNDPDIILADEPTGALDSETSVQIMKILKTVSKTRLVIMVTHNPELAEEYSTRIINLKDGKIISDSNPAKKKELEKEPAKVRKQKHGKTAMSMFTAFTLSGNNLLTKKKRTLLVSLAASIGIIGIALILAVSTGFQNYVDGVQEETLSSYPLGIRDESFSIATLLMPPEDDSKSALSILEQSGKDVVEYQFLANTLRSVATNDLKSFKHHLEDHANDYKDDVTSLEYNYSVDPLIYTIDGTNTLAKLNPSNLFSSMFGGSNMMASFSGYASVFSKITEDRAALEKNYELKAGHWPENYNEMVLVLSSEHAITDLLAYSIGLKDTNELSTMVTKLMSGESVDIKSEPLTMNYEDFLNLDLRLILPYELYKYNDKYGVYEDMSGDKEFVKQAFESAVKLKISGVVYPKNGSMSAILQPGIGYQSSLIDFIINSAKDSEIVQKQLKDEEVDVFSGARFDQETGRFDYAFEDLVTVDTEKLQQAFNITIDQNAVATEVKKQMLEIGNSVTADITPAKDRLVELLEKSLTGVVASVETTEEVNLGTEEYPVLTSRRYIDRADIPTIVETYLATYEVSADLAALETDFHFPKEGFRLALKGVLESYLGNYVSLYNILTFDFSLEIENLDLESLENLDLSNLIKTGDRATISDTLFRIYSRFFRQSTPIVTLEEQLAIRMTEMKAKLEVMQKVATLTETISNSFAKSFNIDPQKITSAFKLNFTEDELMRVVSSMLNKTDSTAKNNLLKLGFQDRDEPSSISIYFASFEGKENFIAFINKYNDMVEAAGEKDKIINFSDTAGILMSSIKVIVDAVSYVLIAFVSISLVVSSIMIGVITYISVFERTKEIGILRAMGASKRNISSIFNAETVIIGLLAGLIGIGVSYSLIPIINGILAHFTGGIDISAALPAASAASLVILSIILTLVGGFIPARSAAKKDPVEALRTE
ncbi:ABC transporter ATP-binding protein/permease [Candidatus Saccharibacteria bacterium]|nr:ABC transporter ATP-binding protein/permease [Candidatus Saccharibacteria bacterium]